MVKSYFYMHVSGFNIYTWEKIIFCHNYFFLLERKNCHCYICERVASKNQKKKNIFLSSRKKKCGSVFLMNQLRSSSLSVKTAHEIESRRKKILIFILEFFKNINCVLRNINKRQCDELSVWGGGKISFSSHHIRC